MFTAYLALSSSLCAAAPAPRGEQPRPDLARADWLSLNGTWDFAFDSDRKGLGRNGARLVDPAGDAYDQRIVVPFPWESRAGGLAATDTRGVGWYRREFVVPTSWRTRRVHLCFGAVDWSCEVWVNGQVVGGHTGGYTPFRLDITDALTGTEAQTVIVRAVDDTDPELPVGKQVRWYTPSSGIWQPVWLEAVAPTHITRLAVSSTLAPPAAQVTIGFTAAQAGPVTLTVEPRGEATFPAVSQRVDIGQAGEHEVTLDVAVPDGRPWSPEDPQLYDCTVRLDSAAGNDAVDSYFGLRTVGRGAVDGAGHESILLNGEPVYLRGALHQVFNPEGLYTFLTDEAIRRDLELTRELGLNFLRLHIKIVDPRFLYWADRLGVLLMCDMPNSWEHSARAREAWEETAHEALARDQQHPSIFSWVCFNESWGIGGQELKQRGDIQEWVAAMTDRVREIDPSRLVEDNSPCLYDHVDTDINSWHFYIDDHAQAAAHVRKVVDETYPGSGFNYCPGRTQGTEPLINSEYGAVSAGGGDRDVAWGFKDLTTLLRAEPKVQGYVYTEHCDIEWEHNGFVCYDRTPKVFGYDAFVEGMRVADLQGADFVGYTGPPCVTAAPGASLEVTPFVSHFSARTRRPELRWRLVAWDSLGRELRGPAGTAPVAWKRFDVVTLPALKVALPAVPCVGAVALELFDGDERIAANYVNVVGATRAHLPSAEVLDAHRFLLRLRPGDLAKAEPAESAPMTPGDDKLAATGRPSFTWQVRLPRALRGTELAAVTLVAEVGARGGDAKLDWPERRKAEDYPQTKEGRTTPTTLRATLNDIELGTVRLADDFADARGVLSHLARRHHGSHGERVELRLNLSAQPDLAKRLAAGQAFALTLSVPDDAADAHGLSVYGERMGRWLLPPTLVFETRGAAPQEPGWSTTVEVTEEALLARQELLVPTAESGGAVWRYALEAPAKDWAGADFDDSAWAEGRGGFGTQGTPGAIVGTRWDGSDIWLRHRFTLATAPGAHDRAVLRVHHDEDVEIHLNGRPVLNRRGYVTHYTEAVLDADALAALRAGENVLAVHCRQTTGGQNIDVGLRLLRR